jgi:hypothetical protein
LRDARFAAGGLRQFLTPFDIGQEDDSMSLRHFAIPDALCLVLALTWRSPAMAASPLFSELRGYSFTADWTIQETETKSNTNGGREYITTKHFTVKLYVSEKGRLFDNRNTAVNGAQRNNFSTVSSSPKAEMIYQPQVGFVSRVVPSDYDKEKTTFVRVSTISVTKSGDGFLCSVSARLVLRAGDQSYIFYGFDAAMQKQVYQIHSFDVTQSSCAVTKGNIFFN